MHALVRKSSFSKAQGLRETGPLVRIIYNTSLTCAATLLCTFSIGDDGSEVEYRGEQLCTTHDPRDLPGETDDNWTYPMIYFLKR